MTEEERDDGWDKPKGKHSKKPKKAPKDTPEQEQKKAYPSFELEELSEYKY